MLCAAQMRSVCRLGSVYSIHLCTLFFCRCCCFAESLYHCPPFINLPTLVLLPLHHMRLYTCSRFNRNFDNAHWNIMSGSVVGAEILSVAAKYRCPALFFLFAFIFFILSSSFCLSLVVSFASSASSILQGIQMFSSCDQWSRRRSYDG